MMTPDIIVSWPTNCDYPLWREFIRIERQRFGQIFVMFTESYRDLSYKEFVKDAMKEDFITFIDAPRPTTSEQDWRDLAINEALRHSRNPWVWFTEQDFFVEPKKLFTSLWTTIDELTHSTVPFDVLAAYDSQRMHPCCIFARRETIEQTSKRFGIVPDKLDHFGIFQQELESSNAKIYRIHPSLYYHYNGLSSNFTQLSEGGKPNYKPEEFNYYMQKCLKASVPLDKRFTSLVSA